MHSPHGQLLDQGKGGYSGGGRSNTAASATRCRYGGHAGGSAAGA